MTVEWRVLQTAGYDKVDNYEEEEDREVDRYEMHDVV